MRVLHVIDSLAGSGGAENRMVEEVIAMGQRFEQRLVRLYERDFLQDRLEAAGIGVVALGFDAGRAARTWPLAAQQLRRVIVDWGPDVVHTALFTGNLVGQLAARPSGVPVLSTFNRTGDLDLQRTLHPAHVAWKARVMRAIGRRAARGRDVHHRALNAYTRDGNCRQLGLGPDRATVVPRGIAIDRAALVTDRSLLGLPRSGPMFVNVGRLHPEKAQHLLVDAFAVVKAALPDAVLVVAGPSGPSESAVRAAITRHGLADSVHLLGFRADARSLMAAADVFAFSSLSEGSPGAVLEAMAVGTPVVAFAIPPVVELTGRHARLAAPGSSVELGRLMVEAYRSPARVDEVAGARRWTERFDLAVIAAELGDLLEGRASPRYARARSAR